ncbi:MAG: hypothetical protein KDE19_11550, partial [Caldilineaceae bacterium]|nr:hypothetical protein [Caldilineaceae bacterium]
MKNTHVRSTIHRGMIQLPLAIALLILLTAPVVAQGDQATHTYIPLISNTVISAHHDDDSTTEQSSLQLINAALQGGMLTTEQAQIYRVQAVVGDSALPAQYQGTDTGLDGTLTMAETVAAFPTLPATTQQTLQPYLFPPSMATSWLAQQQSAAATIVNSQTEWETVTTANGKVKVWYHPATASHGARAVAVAHAVNNTIWPKIVDLLKEPLPDCGANCPTGGGAPTIDIYITNTKRPYIQPFTCCTGSSGFAVIRPDTSFAQITRLLAQIAIFGYPMAALDEYRWLIAATSQYAMDYVYPASNQDPDYPARHEEHHEAPDFLGKQLWPLETVDDRHERGAYLLFYWIDDPSTIADIWANATTPDSLAVVDQQLQDGFRAQWRNFSLDNWNRPPVDYYRQQDELAFAPEPVDGNVITTPGIDEFVVDTSHLTAYYLHFQFPNRDLKRIAIFNPIAGAGDPDVALGALMKIDGTWRAPQDWTQNSHRIFCRDEADQNLEELVLVISDSNWQDRDHALHTDNGTIQTSVDCGGQLSGTVTWHAYGNVELPSGAKTTYERKTVLNVNLRYDEELGEYVDAGSSYSHSGTYRAEGRDQEGKLGYITEWTESGSGDFQADGRYIKATVAPHETTPDELWLGANVTIRKTGTTTYYP